MMDVLSFLSFLFSGKRKALEGSGFALWHIEAATFNQAFFQSAGQKLGTLLHLQIAKLYRGFLQIWKDLGTMGSNLDKKKFDQGHEQEQVRENDKRDHYSIDIGNDTREHTMDDSNKAIYVEKGVDVSFGIENVSSRYASETRSCSPALSDASSCTLRESPPEPETGSNPVSIDSTVFDTQPSFKSLCISPEMSDTPVTPAKKRSLEESELSFTNLEIFNASKRHNGTPIAAFHSTCHMSSRPLQSRNIPQAASLGQRIPLNSLRTHQSNHQTAFSPISNQSRAACADTNVSRQGSFIAAPEEIINLDDDEEDFPAFQIPPGVEVIDLDEYEKENELEEDIFGMEQHAGAQSNLQRAFLADRNPDIVPPNVEIQSLAWKSSLLRPEKTIELKNGTFLKIKTIVKNLASDEISIKGWKLVRTRDAMLGGIAGKKRNELAFIHEVDRDDKRDVWEQSVQTIRVDEVLRIRRLICTNRLLPECRYNKEDIPVEVRSKEENEILKYIENEMVLVARSVFVARYPNAEARVRKGALVDRPRESGILRSLHKEECTESYYIDPDEKKKGWRGETILGGSGNLENGRNAFNFNSQYTYGDGYCGAGGMTRGAASAGLKVKWGFDFNSHAGETWQKNFPDAKFHLLPVHEFAALPDPRKKLWVDILHLSPPCQVFSPIHTCPGRNDEMNYAALFGVMAAIEKARPRIVTLEQTFGILHPKHRDPFNGLIACFTNLGFDVSWKVVRFQGYGTPSRRTRLIILASCPGEPLPHMPQYTHHNPHHLRPSQNPYLTPNKVLSAILPNAPNHDPSSERLHRATYLPWDGNVICRAILTSGAGVGLPNGSRGMTNRELAALQGFPLKHVFYGLEIKKQVGNAVPPIFARRLLESVRRQLERRDEWVRAEGIVLSSDEE
ncbi:putative c-5 cytosine methyltransferase protein [Botrytis fragariae]|uniref:DNA (cytosine-5-)-methyltransferase n=1 Tax=Botrytis fragariae TaxID=1964551 RepID=A0A8H6EP71_9HELO|nr:putative c-5 cytosine methyltransferase protein [Botrytis fragariae]KAF5879467.1 putative c-5 cytosine methyltransferase protein [Botrytis fragariae]